MIYPAELLTNMQGGIINSISFYANSSDYTALSGGSMKVSIGEVEETTPSGHYTTGLTEVFNGVPGKDGVKCVITFDTPLEYNGGNGNWVTEVTWPYDSLSRDDAVRLWYRALTASVDNGGRQWGDSSIADGYITDWPAYTPGCCQYHPYFFMSHPGLVFECYRECPEEIYTIRSLNGFDNHREYHVDASRLAHILSGNHWGLQIFADGATPAYNHIANVFGTSALINNFSNGPAQIWRYEWPFDQYNEQGTVMNSDRQMMTRECTYNGTWTDPSTGIQYQTNMLYNGSPIDTPLNYPVFIAVTGHVNRVW